MSTNAPSLAPIAFVSAPAPVAMIVRRGAEAPVSATPVDASNPVKPAIVAPGRVVVEFDAASSRFIQSLIDAENAVVLARYPNESQLAFSRGVSAYVEAMRRR